MDLTHVTTGLFWTFLHVLVRLSAMLTVAPVFGAREVPAQAKIGLTAVLALAITPVVQSTLPSTVPPTFYGMIVQVATEAVIGLVIGFAASLVFAAIRIGGDVLDYQMGFTQASTFNPQFNETISPFANFQYRFALVLFLLLNGHWVLLQSLVASFTVLPASALVMPTSGPTTFLDITFSMLLIGIQIAAPGASVLLMTDVAFAFLNRAVPQMQVYYVGMPVKIIAGFVIVVATLPVLSYLTSQLIGNMPQTVLFPLLRVLHHP